MRIAFICGSLEEGCDGVGDYVLSMARLLQTRAISCICIALSDKYIDSTHASLIIDRQSAPIQCIRISNNDSWWARGYMLRLKLREFNPDWISLHYVPYAFDNKGLPRQLTHCLGSLGIGAQWHVMAHELWVDPQLRFSNRVLSFIQKFLFKSLITTLSPRLIHTSNAYYQKLLSDLYLNSSVLPMYGSIPIISPEKLSRTTHQGWRFILFGGILPDWDPFPLLHAIVAIAHQQSIQQIEFLSVGSSGNHGVKLWKNLAAVFSEMALFKQLGHLTSPDLSRWMHQSDFGITTSPSHLLGKSSTVASMMEHGLPVIVSRLEKKDGPWHEYLQADRRFVLFDQNFEQTFLSAHKYPQNEQLLATADQFVRSLEESI